MLAAGKPLPFRLRFELPEFKLPERLPSDSDALKTLLIAQRHAMAELQHVALEHFASLYEQIALMRVRQFGPSSEAMSGQARLFDEAEALAAQPCDGASGDAAGDEGPPQDPTTIHAQAQNKRARGKRAPLPSELARVEIVHARVRQLRSQLPDFIGIGFQTCPYNRLSCCVWLGGLMFSALSTWLSSVVIVETPASGCAPLIDTR